MSDISLGAAPPLTPSADTLGETLREAREHQGLSLSDVAEVTHVRKEYLAALDEGRYGDLPEPVYTRNFVRLYAQAVGLDEGRALALYAKARRAPLEVPESSSETETPEDAKEPHPRRQRSAFNPSRLLPTLLTLLLVGVLVGVSVWAFRSLLFPPRVAVVAPSAEETVEEAAEGTRVEEGAGIAEESIEALPNMVTLSLETVPAGAEVSIDNYVFPGTTPIEGQPVTPGEERTLRVSLEGYQTFEEAFDFSFDRNLSVTLVPVGTEADSGVVVATEGALAEDGLADSEDTDGVLTPVTDADGIVVTVTAPAWLEVYVGTARGQGEILAYRNAEAGESLTLSPPVFIYTGNAGGVSVAVDGAAAEPLGADGAVLGQAFSE